MESPLPRDLDRQVDAALDEDLGDGDLTAELIPDSRWCRATVVCRDDAVLAGAPWFDRVYERIDERLTVTWHHHDGDQVTPDTAVCALYGPARALVSGERTALNFLQTLSATATATRRHVDAMGATRTRILDTRKTLPGLRTAQKYAVRCGGGSNHRMGLFDAVLIKENHIAAAGSVQAAVSGIRNRHPGVSVEIEVESLEELDAALDAGADMALLDNFSDMDMRRAVERVAGRMQLEISGGVALEELAQLASIGADFISVGALTKHVHATDFSMRVVDFED